MSPKKVEALTVGLTEAEKHDLEKMIGEFHQKSEAGAPLAEKGPTQAQLDGINQRLADMIEMVLKIDRQMAPLVEIIRLSHQKSELLTQRLDAVIAALKKGRMI